MGTKGRDQQKIIVVVGQTSSGKSNLAVFLSLKLRGEVISADSRQVYKGMDLGSGKITKEEMMSVPHHLLDVASPKRNFSAARYKKIADKKIKEVATRGSVPIICGGTGFYIDVLTGKRSVASTPPNWELRKKLDKKSNEDLISIIEEKDPLRAKSIDRKNRRRIIRAVEIILESKNIVPPAKPKKLYNSLCIGINTDQDLLNKKIEKRLHQRLSQGMLEEVKKLKESGVSWKRIESFGLEYQWTALYLQNKISYDQMTESLLQNIKKFSKRQKTWWRKDKDIYWINSKYEALSLSKDFLKER